VLHPPTGAGRQSARLAVGFLEEDRGAAFPSVRPVDLALTVQPQFIFRVRLSAGGLRQGWRRLLQLADARLQRQSA
jgi:hypothetical protein